MRTTCISARANRLSNRQLEVLRHILFFNDTATTEIYTLSLHDALPISTSNDIGEFRIFGLPPGRYYLSASSRRSLAPDRRDRKSTRLNSSHQIISYAVFCLKKKK